METPWKPIPINFVPAVFTKELKHIDPVLTEYQRGTRWIVIITRRIDLQPQIIRLTNPRIGMFFSIPLLAISIEEEIWRPQYSSVEEYWNNLLHSINWQKVEEKMRILSTIGPVLRLTRFDR